MEVKTKDIYVRRVISSLRTTNITYIPAGYLLAINNILNQDTPALQHTSPCLNYLTVPDELPSAHIPASQSRIRFLVTKDSAQVTGGIVPLRFRG